MKDPVLPFMRATFAQKMRESVDRDGKMTHVT
jgi:hypothetical protein